MRKLLFSLWLAMFLASAPAHAFDHGYATYSTLLNRYVHWLAGGHASRVDYAGLKSNRAALTAVLRDFSAVPQASFDAWSRAQQKAFLINAYNAFTLELILTRYPDLTSIKDLGSLLRSPWKIGFFELLGKTRNLDWIEHEQLRPRYRDPRVHFAIVCASVGCPALRPDAYVADRLDAQLDEAFRAFMADRSRNRFNAQASALEVSLIFKWFREDFEGGFQGRTSLQAWFSAAADVLADRPEDRKKIVAADYPLVFLDYDWALNDAASGHRR